MRTERERERGRINRKRKSGFRSPLSFSALHERHEIMRLANEEVRSIKVDKALREAAQLRLNLPSNMLHHALLKECMLRLDSEVG